MACCAVHRDDTRLTSVLCRWHYEFSLAGFAGGDPASPIRPGEFRGCGGQSEYDLNLVEFRNDGYGGFNDKYFCLDRVRLI